MHRWFATALARFSARSTQRALLVAVGTYLVLPTPAPAEPALILLDSAGKVIGPVIMENWVVLTLHGQAVIMRVNPSGFEALGHTYYFEQPGCAGPKHLQADRIPNAAFLSVDGTSIESPGGPAKVFAPQSRLAAGAGIDTCAPTSNMDPGGYAVVVSTGIGNLGFTPPCVPQLR